MRKWTWILNRASKQLILERIEKFDSDKSYLITVEPDERRTSQQNRLLHAAIEDVAGQVQWAGEWLDKDDWKRLFSAALYGQKVLPSLDGSGFVVLNKRTAQMKKEEVSELLEFVYAFGAERGVKFAEPPNA